MHCLRTMADRAHLWLRLAAIALIALAAAWPRAPRVPTGSPNVAAFPLQGETSRHGPLPRTAPTTLTSTAGHLPAAAFRAPLARVAQAEPVALGSSGASSTSAPQDADPTPEELPLTN